MNLCILPFKVYLDTQVYLISLEFLVYLITLMSSNTPKNLHTFTAAKIQQTGGELFKFNEFYCNITYF